MGCEEECEEGGANEVAGGVEGEVEGGAGEGEAGEDSAPPSLPPGGWEAEVEVPDNLPSEELAFPDVSHDKTIEVPDTLPKEHEFFDDRLPESSVNFLEFMGEEENGERENHHPPTELDSSSCPSSSSGLLAPEFPSVDPENLKTSSPVKERAGESERDPRLLSTARPLLRRQLPALFGGGDVEIISDDETSDSL